ncbi:anthranilate synthase component I family protein [Mesoterricola silvestris]|uniref:Anthranilate synthase component I n=1 Tax=Mesoterricola silvestris TaxID=2927979 RepID=A0AA48K9Q6_9BACT|nr:anthranilate synthase component I family protein [Mesoterricola silvestris]BDU73325.1 anthranilate synthase component I [Mesoterricola silvestris]
MTPPTSTSCPPAAAPLVISFPADLTTPVRAFLALTEPGQDAYLLESVTGGESQARFSFIGLDASEVFEAGTEAALVRDGVREALPGHPLAALEAWAAALRVETPEIPVPFLGGAVGWADFSAFALAEPVLEASFPGARAPRLRFGRFASGLVLDHLKQQGYLYHFPSGGDGEARLGELAARLEGALPERPGAPVFVTTRTPDRARFERNFRAAQEAILAGDAYQIVLSEPFEGRIEGDAFEVYRRLRRLNPSPYHFFVSLGGRQLVGASPEMLVRVEGSRVATVPIAGTRRRTGDPVEDGRLAAELKADPKELAEHAMLVDLSRNDLGRVCAHGSVTVPVREQVEQFSHVMHLISEVHGSLRPELRPLDALWSTFPAGTLSGAPKIRATQVLSALEGEDRGAYGGGVGILDRTGNLEIAITIRSLEIQDGVARFRAGAGIVADSVEASEWAEIHAKAGVLLSALGVEVKR